MLSNDDGIKNMGIDALAVEAMDWGKIVIVAPDRQQTARAKALTFHKPIRVHHSDTISGIPALAFDAPPAVSVIVNEHFNGAPDLVLSGINSGDNASIHSILTSGTAAVAMEAGMKHIPAIALTMDVSDEFFFTNELPGELQLAAKLSILIAKKFIAQSKEFWDDVLFLNINFPKSLSSDTELVFAELDSYKYNNYLRERTDPAGRQYYWLWGDKREKFTKGSDADMLYNHHKITLTPVSLVGMHDQKQVYDICKLLIKEINEEFSKI